jgi:hypothetical protein
LKGILSWVTEFLRALARKNKYGGLCHARVEAASIAIFGILFAVFVGGIVSRSLTPLFSVRR